MSEIYQIFERLSNFFGIGHATKSQILKSVAIQLYEIYKDDFINFTELTNLIGEIIDIHFETSKPYRNFINFKKEKRFVKNVIDTFVVFDIDDKQNNSQKSTILEFYENDFIEAFPELNDESINEQVLLFLDNPVKFYITMKNLKSFGL